MFQKSDARGKRGEGSLKVAEALDLGVEILDLGDSHVTDAGCVTLASVLRTEALPNFRKVDLRADSGRAFSQAHLELIEAREDLDLV